MRGFKDFFHETNDIALAIVVVLLAIGLIGWRLRIILAYPSQIAKEAAASGSTQTEETTETTDSQNSNESDDATDDAK